MDKGNQFLGLMRKERNCPCVSCSSEGRSSRLGRIAWEKPIKKDIDQVIRISGEETIALKNKTTLNTN